MTAYDTHARADLHSAACLANYRDARRRYIDAKQRTILTAEDRAFYVHLALYWRARWDALAGVLRGS